jgi:hypothetical protein
MIPNLRLNGTCGKAATVAVLALVATFSASCEKSPLLAPTGTTIRLTTNTQVLPVNGSAEITASVLEAGGYAVHNGTMVSFTTSLGTVSPSEVGTTDGKATVIFHAGTQAGTAVINAYSGASSTSGSTTTGTGGATTTTGTGVSITVGAVPTITLTGPTTTPTAGLTSTFTVTAAAGTPAVLIRSVVVNFGDGSSVDLGAATGTISVPHVFQVYGTFNVTATATDSSGQSSSMSVPIVVYAAVPFTLTVTAAGGKVGVAVTANAVASAGAPAIQSYEFNFGDGQSDSIVITNIGTASHIYRSIPTGYTSYPFTITVRALGVDNRPGIGSTSVLITP